MSAESPGTKSSAPLPRLRRKRRLDLPKLFGRFSKGVAQVESHVEEYAQRWDRANEAARHAEGPLWVALGDSSSQGVGATEWENGWTHIVLDRLRQATNEPWRIVNLAMSGGRFLDVGERQVPVLNTMLDKPQLITCVIGSNDLMWRRGTKGVYADAQLTVNALPHATHVSKLNGPGPRPAALNQIFQGGADDQGHHLFNVWNWPSGRGALAVDRIHPSDLGYQYMADLAWDSIAERFSL